MFPSRNIPDPSASVPESPVADCTAMSEEEIVQWHQKFLNDDQFAWENILNCCAARSEKMSQILENAGIISNKIFCFGDQTNDPLYCFQNEKFITWEFHTAPTINTKDGTIMVIDPAVDTRPLSRSEWLKKINCGETKKIIDTSRNVINIDIKAERVFYRNSKSDMATEDQLAMHRYYM